MTPSQAWTRGWQVLLQHPWFALIPLAWSVLQMLLAYAGIPSGPVPDGARLTDTEVGRMLMPSSAPASSTIELKAFLPAWLPTPGDLGLALQPDRLAAGIGIGTGAILAGLILVPLLQALLQAVYLVLVADAVVPSTAPQARRVLNAVPWLYLLFLGTRLAQMLLPAFPYWAVMFLSLLLFPILPLTLAVGQRPIYAAPAEFWGRLGPWFSLAWRVALTTVPFSLLWTATGRPMGLALAVYPFLATALVAAAVALYLSPDPELPPAPGPRWAGVVTIPLAVVLVYTGAFVSEQWRGFTMTREAALDEDLVTVVHVTEEGTRELVLYRAERHRLRLAELERSRFGWKRLWREQPPGEMKLAAVAWTRPWPSYSRFLVWGELLDSRVAALEIAGQPFGVVGPYFLIPVSEAPEYHGHLRNLRFLDAQGREVQP